MLAGDIPAAIAMILDTMVDGQWQARRESILATAHVPSASHRRRAFNLQLAAEAAGFFGDVTTCVALIGETADAGAFDLPWIDRCPVLELVRDSPAIAGARARIAHRAHAILDALYGDVEDTALPETAVL